VSPQFYVTLQGSSGLCAGSASGGTRVLIPNSQKAKSNSDVAPSAAVKNPGEKSSHNTWIRQITTCSCLTLSAAMALLCWGHTDQESGRWEEQPLSNAHNFLGLGSHRILDA